MRIVDAHAHIFPHIQGQVGSGQTKGLGYGRMLVGSDEIQLMPAHNEETVYSAEMLLANMDWAGVERAVLLQGPFYGECNAYAQDAARRYPDRLQAVAYLDPWRDGLRAQWAAVGSFAAVKMECSVKTGLCGLYSRARLDDPGLRWLWDVLEESGKVLVLDLGHIGGEAYQTAAVREIAVGHEGLRVVSLVHYGISSYAHGTQAPGGLTERGRPMLRALEEAGIWCRLANQIVPSISTGAEHDVALPQHLQATVDDRRWQRGTV